MKKIFLTLVGIAFSALPLAAFTSQSAQNAVDGVNKVAANVAAAAQVYPFTLSDAPTADGKWSANTNWYFVTLRDEFLKYDETNAQNHIPLKSKTNLTENFLWAFVSTTNGTIEIYNKVAGTTKVLASSVPNGDGGTTYPIMTEKTALNGTIGAWDFTNKEANGNVTTDGSFFLDLAGENSVKMNNRERKLAYWTTSWDNGSKFRVISAANLPIASKAPTASGFDTNTNWYRLTIRGKYLKYDAANTTKIPYHTTGSLVDDACYWAFVASNDGVKIYNKKAGIDKILASGSVSNTAHATMQTIANVTGEIIGEWDVTLRNDGKFLMDRYGNETHKLHDMNGSFGFWTDNRAETDAGSFFAVEKVTSNFPFTLSEAPANGKFSANTTWYYFKLRKGAGTFYKYLNYDDTKQNEIGVPHIDNGNPTPIKYGNLWAFVQDGEGKVKIYNVATGPNKVLASADPTSNPTSTHPCMTDANNLQGKIASWTVNNTPNGGVLGCFKLGITPSTGGTTIYLSDYNGTNNHQLTFWNGDVDNDKGYNVHVEEVNIAQEINKAKAYGAEQQLGAVGTIADNAQQESFNTALAQGNATGLSEALKVEEKSTKVTLDANKYYRLLSSSSRHYMTMDVKSNTDTTVTAKALALDNKNAAQIWNIENSTNSFKHVCTQKRSLKTVVKDALVPTTDESNTGAANYTLVSKSKTLFAFDAEGNANNNYDCLHESNGNIIGWEGNAGNSKWYIIPATTITVTIKAAGYATVNYPFAVQLPTEANSDLKAFTGKIAKSGSAYVFVLRELKDGKIPANTPVILAGTAKDYTLTILDKNATVTPVTENPMAGTYMGKSIPTGELTYVLAKKPTIGFYKFDDTAGANRTIGANKAYVPGSKLPHAAANTFGFAFSLDGNGGGTTGIEETTTDVSNEEFYDLQGRRVLNPTKGIFVTKSGKKVLFMN